MQKYTDRHYVERVSKLDVSTKDLPLELRGLPAEEEAERLLKVRGDEGHQENKVL